jgi:hypothetical protein
MAGAHRAFVIPGEAFWDLQIASRLSDATEDGIRDIASFYKIPEALKRLQTDE